MNRITVFYFLACAATCADVSPAASSFPVLKKSVVIDRAAFLRISAARSGTNPVRLAAIVNNRLDMAQLRRVGYRIVSRTGDVVTLEGPRSAAPYLRAFDGISHLRLPPPFPLPAMVTDTARKYSFLDEVHGVRPSNLPADYTGRNVLVGIIDTEFDTHHPAFIDAQGRVRFVALWDQTDTTYDTPPGGFDYGSVKYQPELQNDSAFGLGSHYHGTGMLGFAAAGDRSTPYYGPAPDARLVAVKYPLDQEVSPYVIDGISWIFHVADSLQLPCVVNLSIGLAYGPHDGTSVVDRAIDNLSGPGRIIVGAMGNDGRLKTHAGFALTGTQTKGAWLAHRTDTLSRTPLRLRTVAGINLWGDAFKTITATMMLYDSSSGQTLQSSSFSSNSFLSTNLFIPDTVYWPTAADTNIFYITGERRNAQNSKPTLDIYTIGNRGHIYAGVKVALSNGGTVHGWHMYKLPLVSFGTTGFVEGDSTHSVNEIGGTANQIITVTAYINKTAVTTWDGVFSQRKSDDLLFRLAEYCSFGPTADGRVKPEITAPGDALAGATSRNADAFNETVWWPDTSNTLGRYTINGGTSVAAPFVAGIVACMLEQEPQLTRDEVVTLLQSTAYADEYTGPIDSPNNTWGAGKVNALAAMQSLVGVPVAAGRRYRTFAKPGITAAGAMVRVSGVDPRHPVTVRVFSLDGRMVARKTFMRDGNWGLSNVAKTMSCVVGAGADAAVLPVCVSGGSKAR